MPVVIGTTILTCDCCQAQFVREESEPLGSWVLVSVTTYQSYHMMDQLAFCGEQCFRAWSRKQAEG